MMLAYAENPESGMESLKRAIDDYFSIIRQDQSYGYANTVWKPWDSGQSSFLIEKGQSIDCYRREKAFDGDPTTAWAEGKKDSGVGEYLLCIIDMSSMYYEQFRRNEDYRIEFTMDIVDGFAKNENLFKKNNRIKKAEITIYDFDIVPFNPDGSLIDEPGHIKGAYMGRDPVGDPTIVVREVFDLEDTVDTQRFVFSGRPHYEDANGAYGGVLFCVAKIRILDVFKGTTYDDTCLSELRINAELRR